MAWNSICCTNSVASVKKQLIVHNPANTMNTFELFRLKHLIEKKAEKL